MNKTRPDPRIRQNLDRISTSLESAADNVRTGCFTFTKTYIEPCLSSLVGCCTSCLPQAKAAHHHHHHHHHHRHHRNRYARRSEYPFGFYDYDDYGSDEDDGGRGFLAWGTDELDRLLAGSGASSRGERMFYGSVGDTPGSGLRRKNTMSGRDSPDPTVIPGTNMFGFLSRFGIRGKGMRYKPSAANLQEHPQRGGTVANMAHAVAGLGRKRSGTGSSVTSQGDSLRSRGDLWPSEDEDDAVVIGDDAFPRSSDGESTDVLGLGVGADDDDGVRQEDLLVEMQEDEEEGRKRRMIDHARRLTTQRGLSSGSMEESKARSIYSKESNSAPPTILVASPDLYLAGLGVASLRPESVRSWDSTSIHHQQLQRPLSPLGMPVRKDKEETVSEVTPTIRPQMRQVISTHSSVPQSPPPAIPVPNDPKSAPRILGKGVMDVDDINEDSDS